MATVQAKQQEPLYEVLLTAKELRLISALLYATNDLDPVADHLWAAFGEHEGGLPALSIGTPTEEDVDLGANEIQVRWE
jgi:hypothetical protein